MSNTSEHSEKELLLYILNVEDILYNNNKTEVIYHIGNKRKNIRTIFNLTYNLIIHGSY